MTEKVVIGKVGAPFGVKGQVKVHSYTRPLEQLLAYAPLWVKTQGQWQAVTIESGELREHTLYVHFKGIEDRDAAAHYRLCELAVDKAQLPKAEEGSFYWRDLENLTVLNTKGQKIGKVAYLYENTGQDIMVVETGKGKSHEHIPFYWQDIVKSVDLAAKTITVDWEVEP